MARSATVVRTTTATASHRKAHTKSAFIAGATGALLVVGPPLLVYFSPAAVGQSFRVIGLTLIASWLAVMLGGALARIPRREINFSHVVLVAAPVLLAFQGMAVAVLHANPVGYVISDLLRLLMTGLVVAFIAMLRRSEFSAVVRGVVVVVLVVDMATLLVQITRILGASSLVRVNGGSLAGLAALLWLWHRASKKTHRIIWLGVLHAEVAVIVLSQTRGLWIGGALLLLLILSLVSWTDPRTAVAVTMSLGLVAIGVVLAVASLPDASQGLQARIESTLSTDVVDSSFATRESEVNASVGSLADGLSLLVGRGLGAEYRHQGELEHHIHNTPASVLYRHGALGFGIFVFWLLSIVLTGMRAWRRSKKSFAAACVLAMLAATMIVSLSAYSLVGDSLAVMAIGTTLRLSLRESRGEFPDINRQTLGACT